MVEQVGVRAVRHTQQKLGIPQYQTYIFTLALRLQPFGKALEANDAVQILT
jgi:hypothetical protein